MRAHPPVLSPALVPARAALRARIANTRAPPPEASALRPGHITPARHAATSRLPQCPPLPCAPPHLPRRGSARSPPARRSSRARSPRSHSPARAPQASGSRAWQPRPPGISSCARASCALTRAWRTSSRRALGGPAQARGCTERAQLVRSVRKARTDAASRCAAFAKYAPSASARAAPGKHAAPLAESSPAGRRPGQAAASTGRGRPHRPRSRAEPVRYAGFARHLELAATLRRWR